MISFLLLSVFEIVGEEVRTFFDVDFVVVTGCSFFSVFIFFKISFVCFGLLLLILRLFTDGLDI